MKEGKYRRPALRCASSLRDAPGHALRPHTGPYRVFCWLCTCVFLEQVGDRLWQGPFYLHQDVLLASPLLHHESSPKFQSDVLCGWIQGTNKWTSESGGKAHFPPPSSTLSPLCPNRNLLERKCGRRENLLLIYTHWISPAKSTIPEKYIVFSIIDLFLKYSRVNINFQRLTFCDTSCQKKNYSFLKGNEKVSF